MLLVERQPNITAPADATGGFRLRIQGDASDEQLVDLPQGKTTIGSSPRCVVRMQQPGVHPLHCLILCDGDNLSVRRWAAGTRLNGRPFDEAPLVPGDRLSVGSIELLIEGPLSAAGETEIKEPSIIEPSRSQPPVDEETSASGDYWGEWRDAQQTKDRQNDAFQQPSVVETAPFESPAERPAEWDQRVGEAAEQTSGLTDLRERLSYIEQELVASKKATADWQRQWAEWRTEREETQRRWAEFERQVGELQSRGLELVRRIESVEQGAAVFQASSPELELLTVSEHRASAAAEQSSVAGLGRDFAADSPSPLAAPTSPSANVAPPAAPETDDELAPFADFSIWRQGVDEEHLAAESDAAELPIQPAKFPAEQHAVEPPEPREAAEPPEATDSQNAPAKSFIERYAHMFAEENVAADQPPSAPPISSAAAPDPSDSDDLIRKPRNMEIVRRDGEVPAAANDEEESIEQYMSKLLQRVRGDTPAVRASQGPPEAPSTSMSSVRSGPLTAADYPAATVGAPAQPTVAGELPGGAAKGDWLTTSLGTVRRKAPIVEQPADLETLRALANETARRAISTHGLRTHRRNAVTKVIVSTLAGMTSLWLMLEAPHWRDLQFISACVSLIVAAYWAGQTYGELIETLRAAAYDGPEDQLEGFADPLYMELPIDVEP